LKSIMTRVTANASAREASLLPVVLVLVVIAVLAVLALAAVPELHRMWGSTSAQLSTR